jgi:hypothetical protein
MMDLVKGEEEADRRIRRSTSESKIKIEREDLLGRTQVDHDCFLTRKNY